jgi:hypothetical protein
MNRASDVDAEQERLGARIAAVTGWEVRRPVRVFADTTYYTNFVRGDVLRLAGRDYVVVGEAVEGRFGLDDQPKPWVKVVRALDDGAELFLKLVFHEHFTTRLGAVEVRRERSQVKESLILDLVRGHPHFMQGATVRDAAGNGVRVIELIRGPSLYGTLLDLPLDHERYAAEVMPGVFREMLAAVTALTLLDRAGTMHGDLRNDHLLVDAETGRYRWIDFDMDADFPAFDLWCLGNVLGFVAGKGIVTFHDLGRGSARAPTLGPGDASAVFPARVMNLGKVYPYLPARLVRVLARYSVAVGAAGFYRSLDELLDDLHDVAAGLAAAPASR